MKKNRKRPTEPLPDQFSSAEEAGEFWDTHSGADYEQHMKEVQFEVELKRRAHDVRVTDNLLREVRKIARQSGVATETLVNLWLQEKVAAASGRRSL
jgi:predicted DNA binding CopG/RHH family protein